MKKYAFLLFTLFGTASGYAQEFYLRAGIGYAFPHAGQTIDGAGLPYSGTSNNSYSGSANNFSYNIDKVSLNSGPRATLGLGYLFTEHIGVDLAFNGNLSTNEYRYTVTGEYVDSILSDVTFVNKAQNPLTLIPSVVLQTGGQLNMYSRVGLALPLKTTVIWDQILSNQPGTGALTVRDLTLEIHNKFSLGLSAALGASYKTTNGLSIWLEASLLSLPVYTKEAEVVDYTINGVSYLPEFLRDYPGTVTYSRNFTGEAGDFFNQPSYSLPFSNIGINLGVSFALGGETGDRRKDNNKRRK